MPLPNPYDELPYRSQAITEMNPNRMATLGLLFGLNPAPVGTCRILDIGCAEGGNVIPLAVAFPGAHVVGVDLSERQIAMGRERIRALGLSNIELVRADLAELASGFGPFDYIATHGVYSWVSPPMQEKLLQVCHDLLAPDGIAYVSYNTFPGWNFRSVMREVARFRSRREKDPVRQVQVSREILGIVAASGDSSTDSYRALLAKEWSLLENVPDEYFFHEYLEVDNNPCWFHEFAERAAAAGLTYVTDVRLGATPVASVHPDMAKALEGIALDRIEREQYVDFLGKRSFRQSLLCRDERTPLEEPDVSVVDRLHVATFTRPVAPPVDLAPGVRTEFVSSHSARLTTDDPFLKAVFALLWDRFPATVPFPELLGHLPVPLDGAEEDPVRLRAAILKTYSTDFLDLLEHVPAFVSKLSPLPVASPLARLQAGLVGESVTTLLHRNISVDDHLARLVLARLDGTRDAAALARETAEIIHAEGLMKDDEGNVVTDLERVREAVGRAIEPVLDGLLRSALLMA